MDQPDDPRRAREEMDRNASAGGTAFSVYDDDPRNAKFHEKPEDGNEHGEDIDDLHDQAMAAMAHRVDLIHQSIVNPAAETLDRELVDEEDETKAKQRRQNFHDRKTELHKEAHERAHRVYKDAIARRGRRQAALDQLQGAVGLPLDPAARQAEIERREKLNAEANPQTGPAALATPVPVSPGSLLEQPKPSLDPADVDLMKQQQAGITANRETPGFTITSPQAGVDADAARAKQMDYQSAQQAKQREMMAAREQQTAANKDKLPNSFKPDPDRQPPAGGLTDEQLRQREALASDASVE